MATREKMGLSKLLRRSLQPRLTIPYFQPGTSETRSPYPKKTNAKHLVKNPPIFKSSNSQIFKFSNFQIPTFPHFHISTFPHFPISLSLPPQKRIAYGNNSRHQSWPYHQ